MAISSLSLLALIGVVIAALGGFAGWLLGVPLLVVIPGSVAFLVVLAMWLTRQRRKERVSAAPSDPGKHG